MEYFSSKRKSLNKNIVNQQISNILIFLEMKVEASNEKSKSNRGIGSFGISFTLRKRKSKNFLKLLVEDFSFKRKKRNEILFGNRYNWLIAIYSKFPRIDFKKLVVKAVFFWNRNDNINFFGLCKSDDAF